VSDVHRRLVRLLQLVEDEPATIDDSGVAGRLDRICRAAVRALPADGAGVTLMDQDSGPVGTIAASGPRFRRLEDLQFTMGEGPCIDAYAGRSPVLEADLATSGQHRWPGYASAAREEGVNAVFAFPIQVGAARLGVLDLYRYEGTPLSRESVSDALYLANICLSTMLRLGAETSVDGSGDARPVDPGDGTADGRPDDLGDPFRLSSEVYQAQGAITVQLGISLAEAMVRLRAHAYAAGRPISDVARDVLAGTIDFTREDL
jgi:hypothetical protein